ncbi:HAMP domain-containing sensor histidine kinase [Synechococcus sp. MU1625]|uniref:sensor histidine kinase n=1 Tax=Synechococcus sp. MU1625 TaxID=2508347 RepID=UPI001CF7FDF3|nr:HAMP domain-containing sensor histidine kinase [Synechococcus sp. MU1625]MCB4398443.1 HAMP domain-containing histidine kinase [Synechococcus sp. MU1625]
MPSRYRWRQRLLGRLQGQLQLATYLVVFLGFTGASSVGLFIGQRNLLANDRQLVRQSIELCEDAITDLQSDPARLEQELLFHSNLNTNLWIEGNNGVLVRPRIHQSLSAATIQTAMATNPGREPGLQHTIDVDDQRLVTELIKQLPDGSRLWMAQRASSNLQALNNYLVLMIMVWGSCLAITLLSVSWVVRRVVQPLDQLNAATSQLTADTLANAKLQLGQGPDEVMQLSRTYNDLLERLAQSWSQQRQFVSAVSHELRTPLTIVQGYLHRTIKRGNNLSPDQVKGLETAEDESIRMRRLLDDLLDLSRSDSGKLAIANEPVRLTDQLEQVADLARNTLNRPLLLELPDDPRARDAMAHADPPRLRQVLLDLIENADKYSPENTPIRLVLRHSTDASLVDVIDQGIGIPEQELDQVFQRFQRASNAPAKTGSGLGLSVVKLLVEGMGGSIEVHSRLGEGSCFTVILPS